MKANMPFKTQPIRNMKTGMEDTKKRTPCPSRTPPATSRQATTNYQLPTKAGNVPPRIALSRDREDEAAAGRLDVFESHVSSVKPGYSAHDGKPETCSAGIRSS